MKRWAAIVCAALMSLSIATSTASAASGEITRAIASPDWMTGSIAGTVTDDCGEVCAYWAAVASLEPSNFKCPPFFPEDRSVDYREFWSSGAQESGATASFDFAEMPIIPGLVGQQVCLFFAEPRRDEAVASLGMVATQVLSVPSPPAPAQTPAPGPSAAPALTPACTRAGGDIERFRSLLQRARSAGHTRAAERWRKALKKAITRKAASC